MTRLKRQTSVDPEAGGSGLDYGGIGAMLSSVIDGAGGLYVLTQSLAVTCVFALVVVVLGSFWIAFRV
jgi:hypothetical protein